MNKFVFLFLACVVALSSISAQQLTWLPEVPGAKKDAGYSIGATANDETFVNLGDKVLILDQATLKPKQSIAIKELTDKGLNGGIFKTENGWVATGIKCNGRKKDSDCKLVWAALGGNGFGPTKELMDFKMKDYESAGSFKVASPNGKYLLLSGKEKFALYDASFTKIVEKDFPDIFKLGTQKTTQRKSQLALDDEGNMFGASLLMKDQGKSAEASSYGVLFYKYDRQADQFSHQLVELPYSMVLYSESRDNYILSKKETNLEGRDDVQIAYDVARQRFVVAGIYADGTGGGVFAIQYDCKGGQAVPLQKHPFPADLTEKIAISSFNEKKIKGSVIMQDLLIKANGDMVLLLELDNSKINTGYNTLGIGNVAIGLNNGTRPSSDIEVLDVIYFNLGLENELKFYGNIPKRQIGKEIREEMIMMPWEELSFVAVTAGNDFHVIYNTLSKAEGRELLDVKIDAQGQISRKNLMTLGKDNAITPNKLEWNISVSAFDFEWISHPSLGVLKPLQVADSIVMVRAIKNKKNTLLKISY